MIKSGKWTTEEIQKLKESYEIKKPLKVIAFEFGRTQMSVNKALKRFGIRISKRPANSIKKHDLSPTSTYYKEKSKRLELGWNTQHDLIQWLKFNNYEVIPFPSTETPFKINGLKSTLGQILLIANRIRITKNLPIFRVVGITND